MVVPRYGVEILGGAELGARMLAERLVAQLGWSVEVFTTCAQDHMTWADVYRPGDHVLNGVVVHRLRGAGGRPPAFFSCSERLLSHPASATLAEASTFIDLQGPTVPQMIDAVAGAGCELVAFYPYLYATTVRVLPAVADRAIMHAAAHDEGALHLPVFRSVFRGAAGFVHHSRSEQALVERTFGVGHRPQVVLGLGYEEPPAPDGDEDRVARIVGERPYLLSLGRVDGLKGTTLLGALFAQYKQRKPGPLRLVIAGPVTAAPPAHPDVVLTGAVDEADKWALLRHAVAFVQPSPHESFSVVTMEAWSQGLPVLVNARCDVTREHCQVSGGGLWFSSYATFEAAVDRLVADEVLRGRLGRAGRRWVRSNYRWPAIVERYGRFTTGLLDGGAPR